MPGGVAKTFIPTKEPELTGGADEWLARLCCFAFSVSPQPFVRMMSRATAETAQDQAASEGLAPIQNWVKQLVDDVIAAEFGASDLEFRWKDDRAGDPAGVAQVATDYVKNGIKSVNEVRAELGLDPVAGGDAPMILTAQGPVPLGARAPQPLVRYNPNHYGPGPQGGQFAPAGEGGGTGNGATRTSATSGGPNPKPWVGQPHEAFRQAIAAAEKTIDKPNNGYGESNPDGDKGPALGRYQLTPGALKDAGWEDKTTGAWNSQTGVTSNDQFLQDPGKQESAMSDVLDAYQRQIEAYRLDQNIGNSYQGKVDTITVTESGLVAAVHRAGIGAVVDYFHMLQSAGGQTGDIPMSPTRLEIETRLRTFQNVPY